MAGGNDALSTPVAVRVELADESEARALYGVGDRTLRRLRDHFGVKLVARETTIRVEGPAGSVSACEEVLARLRAVYEAHGQVADTAVDEALAPPAAPGPAAGEDAELQGFRRGVIVRARTPGQHELLKAIRRNELVFAVGPAGSGKTYLAVAAAAAAMRNEEVQRIVLVRPAVEAGEKLGFLPGDIQAKISPYMRPLYDALHDMIEPRQVRMFVENDLLEIVPLAYMRGRTLAKAFIILDEAQNCTVKQMKMFLTRMGPGAKAVVTGDVSQSDLDADEEPGLVHVQRILKDVPGVKFVYLGQEDIVRHRLVQDIVRAYNEGESRRT